MLFAPVTQDTSKGKDKIWLELQELICRKIKEWISV